MKTKTWLKKLWNYRGELHPNPIRRTSKDPDLIGHIKCDERFYRISGWHKDDDKIYLAIYEVDQNGKNIIIEETQEVLPLDNYNGKNGIYIICKNCKSEFEETAEGYYEPIVYESDKYDRECRYCLGRYY